MTPAQAGWCPLAPGRCVNRREFAGGYHAPPPYERPETGPRVVVGGPQGSQPYKASVLNVSAMSFGALSAAAVRALNKGASLGGFYQDTGEGGISPYHLEYGGDLVWELGTGYFGCRDGSGRFDEELFREQARRDAVRMVEIKLSQGAKPGIGHPADLQPHHVFQYVRAGVSLPIDRVWHFLPENVLLESPEETPYSHWWRAASAESFKPAIALDHVRNIAPREATA